VRGDAAQEGAAARGEAAAPREDEQD
jgi:hypothetical protein